MKVAKIVESSFVGVTSNDKKIKMDEIALSTIILHLFDNVSKNVSEVKIVLGMWVKLEKNCFLKSLCLIISICLNNFLALKWIVPNSLMQTLICSIVCY